MRSTAPSLLAWTLALALAACSKPKPDATPVPVTTAPPPPVASAAPSAPASAPPARASGNMAHCPNTVAGTTTVIEDVPGGVALTVKASDEAGTNEVRNRVSALVASTRNDATPVTHNGTGEGGGIYGRCPVVMRNTKVDATPVDHGSRIVVIPREPKEQDWLRREARSRLMELGIPGAAGAGAGKMAHCPNAVKGAATSIKESSGAVLVTVTAKNDAAVKEIRERAQQILLASKKSETGEIKHDGSGNGGGGFGRCPIVLKDTAVAEKDTEGGALFTVKPKNAKDLPALEKQVRERTAKFEE